MNPPFSFKQHRIPLLLLILLTSVIFLNTFQNPFIWDDEVLIVKNQYIKDLNTIPFLFTPTYWKDCHPGTAGQYRPLRTASFAFDYAFWKLNYAGYHFTNLVFHILNSILVYFVMFALGNINKKPGDAVEGRSPRFINPHFLAAVFFAAHPMHVESVTWIKNRTDVLSLFFFLISFLCVFFAVSDAKKKRAWFLYVISIICFILSLLSKEMGISLPVLIAAYALYFLPADKRKKILVGLIPFFIIASARLLFVKHFVSMPRGMSSDAYLDIYPHVLVVIKTFAYYVGMLFLPFHLNPERKLMIPQSFAEPVMFASLLGVLCCVGIMIVTAKRSRPLSFAISWVFITLLPASNIVFLATRPVAEQRLYIPSVGFCYALALGITAMAGFFMRRRARQGSIHAAVVCSLGIVIIYSGTTIQRNHDWKDPVTLWEKTVRVSPNSARAYANLGNAYNDIGAYAKSIPVLKKSIELDPTDPAVYNNLGVAYGVLGKQKEAVTLIKKAIDLAPDYTDAYKNLGMAYTKLGLQGEVVKAYKKVVELSPRDAEAYYNAGVVYYDNGHYQEAMAAYQKAIEFDPHYTDAYNNLAVIFNQTGRSNKAAAILKDAIQVDPGKAQIYYNLGNAYMLSGNLNEAAQAFQTVIQLTPDYAGAHDGLGRAYMGLGRPRDAIVAYLRAVELDPRFGDAYYDLGNAYNAVGDHQSAITAYKHVIDIYPDHAEAHNNLGTAYEAIGQREQAIALYKKAIRLNSRYAQAYQNLAITYFNEKQYALAIEYCDKAIQLGLKNEAFFKALEPYREQ